jgi:phosphoribosylcarboxyaminoimidazole (NCAIR) mutase
VRILGTTDEKLRAAMEHFQADLAQQVRDKDARVQERFGTE